MTPVARVSEVAKQIRGVTYSKSEASAVPGAGLLPILRAGNVGDGGLNFDDLVYVPAGRVGPTQRIRANDVIVAASSGSLDVVGKTARSLDDHDAGFGAFCKVLRPGGAVDPSYFRITSAPRSTAAGFRRWQPGSTSTISATSTLIALKSRFHPCPSSAGSRTSWTRRMRCAPSAAPPSPSSIRSRRRFSSRCSGTPPHPPQSGPWIGLGVFAGELRTAHTSLREWSESGCPFLFVSNIVGGELTFDTQKFITDATYHELTRRCPIELGDVLYSTVGSYGVPAVVETTRRFAFQRHIAQLKPRPDLLNSRFLWAMLASPGVKRQADQAARGIAQKTVNLADIRKFVVFRPPLSVQDEFAGRVAPIQALVLLQRSSLADLDALFASLQHRAFRGEL